MQPTVQESVPDVIHMVCRQQHIVGLQRPQLHVLVQEHQLVLLVVKPRALLPLDMTILNLMLHRII